MQTRTIDKTKSVFGTKKAEFFVSVTSKESVVFAWAKKEREKVFSAHIV